MLRLVDRQPLGMSSFPATLAVMPQLTESTTAQLAPFLIMGPTRLHVNTDVHREVVVAPKRSAGPPNVTASTLVSQARSNGVHTRSGSTASTSSSISVVSPCPSSSASASSSSLHLPEPATESSQPTSQSNCSPHSPSPDATVRVQPSAPEYVLALHDFVPQQQNATCLSFRAGQVVRVFNRDPSGWWDGELHGQRGWFPSNYVSADERVISLTEDQLRPSVGAAACFPQLLVNLGYRFSQPRQPSRHAHTMSAVSTASWATTPSRGSSRRDHRPLVTEALGPDIASYCPPLMVNLLQSLSLLQSAVRSNRVTHFQPSTACIISCVRFILSSVECLPREAPLLKRFPPLAFERKQILSVLAALVSQARRASDETCDEDARDAEIEGMLKLGGQVFSQVRRFLAVAVQCGIELPERGQSSPTDSVTSAHLQLERASPDPMTRFSIPPLETIQLSGEPPGLRNLKLEDYEATGPARTTFRAKSLGDLRSQRKIPSYRDSNPSVTPLLPRQTVVARAKKEQYFAYEVTNRHKPAMPSISSTSSFSSFSSAESPRPPTSSSFPSGPSTSAEVMDALKHTQDQYLSTIAAFIGHAHSHSRSSHASSTGHMYELVREIVEMVCKLLTIVEAVMRHPEIPKNKIGNLKAAKEGLYNVTSSLAESVRLLMVPLSPDATEEAEKASLIRSATAACRAGADCVSAVKICLSRTSTEQQFVIQVPVRSDSSPAPFTPSRFSRNQRTGSSLHQSHRSSIDGGDVTVQGQAPTSHVPKTLTRIQETFSDSSVLTGHSKSSDNSQDTAHTSLDEQEMCSNADPLVSDDVTSPCPNLTNIGSGGVRGIQDAVDALEDELVQGGVSPVTLDVKRDPLGRDHSIEDVIYNADGHLVAASLEVLVEKMIPHDSIVDPAFSAVFFLTFRLFSTPMELVQALIHRYNVMPPADLSEEDMLRWQQYKGIPIRLRVSNFVKTWLEMYWRSGVDDVALRHLESFTREALQQYFPGPSQRILDLIAIRQDANTNLISPKSERARDPGMSINPPSFPSSEIPRPMMTKTLLSNLRNKNFDSVTVTEFDALELARQLTIMECDLYCAIQPEEVLETGQEGSKPPVNVRAVSSLSTIVTGWVAENILSEHDIKKRTFLVKFFIKVADVSDLVGSVGIGLKCVYSDVHRCTILALPARFLQHWTPQLSLACIRRGL